MSKMLIGSGVMLLWALQCSAAPVCVEGSIGQLFGSTGCTIGDLLFRNLTLTGVSTGSLVVPDPTIVPVTDSGNPGVATLFLKYEPVFVSTPFTVKLGVDFIVDATVTPEAQIVQATETTIGQQFGASVIEVVVHCTSVPVIVQCGDFALLSSRIAPGTPEVVTDEAKFHPLSQMGIFTDISLNDVFGPGSVQLNSISYTFKAVTPEPSTYIMVLPTLGLVVFLYRRHRRAAY